MNKPEQALRQWQKKVLPQKGFTFLSVLLKIESNAKVYVVGGIVRDLLLGTDSKDYDFVVTGVEPKKLEKLLRRFGKVDLVGKNFGVYKFLPKEWKSNEAIDIALPRLEKYPKKSGAYTDVKVISRANIPIEEDLLRRDYTINALAWDIKQQKLIDVCSGLQDLRQKKLRTVGKPAERYAEDYSRILRGLRFAATLDFKFETKTWQVLKSKINNLNKKVKLEYIVPREVIANEFVKSLYKNPLKTIELYDKSGAFSVLMPEVLAMKKCPQPKLFHTEGDVWRHSLMAVEALNGNKFKSKFGEHPDAELIFTVFVHDIGKPPTLRTPVKHKVDRIRFDGHDVVGATIARQIIERLKLSSLPSGSKLHIDADNVAWLVKYHLLLLNDNVKNMKATTLEKYFVAHPLSQKLKQLMWVDTLASLPKSGRPVTKHLLALEKAIQKLPQDSKKKLPKPILSGNEIMHTAKIKSGPEVGRLLEVLREQQLTGKVTTKLQARQFIKKHVN